MYRSALKAGFVFDDSMFFGQWCWQIEELNELFKVASTGACAYRPIRYLSLALDHALWARNPFGYHLTNLVIYAVTLYLVFFLFRKIVRHPLAALAGTLLWGLHPVHTDVVTYIAGRRDLLFTLFFLAAFLVWPFSRQGWVKSALRVLLSAGFFVLAFQSKEMAITLPAVLVLYMAFQPSFEAAAQGAEIPSPVRRLFTLVRQYALWLTVMFGLAFAFLLYRGLLHPATNPNRRYWGEELSIHIMTVLAAYSKHLELIFFPIRLYGDYSDFPLATSLADWRVWAGLAFVAAIWGGGIGLVKRCPYLSFGLLWFGITMLPVSQIIYHHELLAEHYLYLPMVGLVVPLARLVERSVSWPRWQWVISAATVAVLVLFSIRIEGRNQEFRDEEAFGQAIMHHVPDTVRGRLIVAHMYQKQRRFEEAAELFRWVLSRPEVQPRFRASALENLIKVYATTNELERAEQLIQAALRRDPNYALGLRVLGTIYARRGEVEQGLEYLERALEIAPHDVEGHLHYGMTLMLAHRLDEATEHIQFAAERWRQNPYAQLQWALLQFAKENSEEARRGFERVLELDPVNRSALEHLFLMARRANDNEWACEIFTRLQPLRPDLENVRTPCDSLQSEATP
ncbi:MAG: tetratricopeptide repeat protein [Bradymonadales bacterium]|nr:tetratricopeptide repeat protein [Bradymonadales bacterium]